MYVNLKTDMNYQQFMYQQWMYVKHTQERERDATL